MALSKVICFFFLFSRTGGTKHGDVGSNNSVIPQNLKYWREKQTEMCKDN